jgi:hypothetical protein
MRGSAAPAVIRATRAAPAPLAPTPSSASAEPANAAAPTSRVAAVSGDHAAPISRVRTGRAPVAISVRRVVTGRRATRVGDVPEAPANAGLSDYRAASCAPGLGAWVPTSVRAPGALAVSSAYAMTREHRARAARASAAATTNRAAAVRAERAARISPAGTTAADIGVGAARQGFPAATERTARAGSGVSTDSACDGPRWLITRPIILTRVPQDRPDEVNDANGGRRISP